MKKFLLISIIFVVVTPIVPLVVNAATDTINNSNPSGGADTINSSNPAGGVDTINSNNSNSTAVSTLDNPLKVNSLGDLVKSGIQVFSYIAVLIAVLMFIVVGLRYILAQGKPEKMKEASQWLLYIVIGVAIVIGANVAITIVINTLSATGVVDPKVIQSAQNAIK